MEILIKKIDGTTQTYDPKKVLNSLQHAGAELETAKNVEENIRGKLYNGIDTKTIYSYAFRELKRHKPILAARYDLKNAMLRLGGHEGYAFEKFVARLMEAQGYKTQTDVIIQGKIIPHEIDVIAEKEKEKIMVECKHHQREFIISHIQTALYVYARFLDVKKDFTKPMLATNTKFTPQVLTYARGVGLRLFGWGYPRGEGIDSIMDKNKIYPITMHHKLRPEQAEKCIRKGIVTLLDIEKIPPRKLAMILETSEKNASGIIKEAGEYSSKN
ncbi:restriction endonuclease [Candidatus Woesearchaeota archaeon]|nr:restriction endonuclease [Candidatus Woesearchaeota archaeon]